MTKGANPRGAVIAPPDPWDPLVRLTHWTIAGVVIWNGLIDKPGGVLHIWLGWIAMLVLAIRVIWGFIGTPSARFSSFLPDPRATLSHLLGLFRGEKREYPSHNPAGAAMVYALWLSLAIVIVTGLSMTEYKNPILITEEKSAVAAGDWSVLVKDGAEADEKDDLPKEIHETFANLMLILALVHVAGVAVESRILNRNLVRPMIKGTRR